jgi:hypothetical protein
MHGQFPEPNCRSNTCHNNHLATKTRHFQKRHCVPPTDQTTVDRALDRELASSHPLVLPVFPPFSPRGSPLFLFLRSRWIFWVDCETIGVGKASLGTEITGRF